MRARQEAVVRSVNGLMDKELQKQNIVCNHLKIRQTALSLGYNELDVYSGAAPSGHVCTLKPTVGGREKN